MTPVSDFLKITIRDRWTNRESSHYYAKLSSVSKNDNSISYKPLSTSSGEVGEPMGHSRSHTMKVLSLKNAMETLVLLHPLVDSLNQVILFLVFIIFTSYSCQSILGGTSVTNAAGLRWRKPLLLYLTLVFRAPPPPVRIQLLQELPYVPSIRH